MLAQPLQRVIASTGAMLIVGHEAPCRISALACRIESRKHIGKKGNSRQVSGTSDASKTQSGLIRSLGAGGTAQSASVTFDNTLHRYCGLPFATVTTLSPEFHGGNCEEKIAP